MSNAEIAKEVLQLLLDCEKILTMPDIMAYPSMAGYDVKCVSTTVSSMQSLGSILCLEERKTLELPRGSGRKTAKYFQYLHPKTLDLFTVKPKVRPAREIQRKIWRTDLDAFLDEKEGSPLVKHHDVWITAEQILVESRWVLTGKLTLSGVKDSLKRLCRLKRVRYVTNGRTRKYQRVPATTLVEGEQAKLPVPEPTPVTLPPAPEKIELNQKGRLFASISGAEYALSLVRTAATEAEEGQDSRTATVKTLREVTTEMLSLGGRTGDTITIVARHYDFNVERLVALMHSLEDMKKK